MENRKKFRVGDRVRFTQRFKDRHKEFKFKDDLTVVATSADGSTARLGDTIYYGSNGEINTLKGWVGGPSELEHWTKEYKNNLEKELDEITTMGFKE